MGCLYDGKELLRIPALLAWPIARSLAAAERHVVVHARRRQAFTITIADWLWRLKWVEYLRLAVATLADNPFGIIGRRQRFLVVFDPDHARHRTEDLFLVDAHRCGRLTRTALSVLLDDRVPEETDAFDFYLANIAGFHETGRLLAPAHTGRCTCCDDVAGRQGKNG